MTAIIDMATSEETDETKTESNYILGKFCSWVLGLCEILFVECMHCCLILLVLVEKV